MEEESKKSKLHEVRTFRMQGLHFLFRLSIFLTGSFFTFSLCLFLLRSSSVHQFPKDEPWLFRPRHSSFSSHSFNSFVSNSLEDALWRWQGLLNLVEHDQRRVTYRRSSSESRRVIGMVGRSDGSIEMRMVSMFVYELKRDPSPKIQWNFRLDMKLLPQ